MYIYICTCIYYEQAKPWSFLAGTLRFAMRDIMKLLITRSSSSQPMIAMIAMRYNKTLAPPVQTSQVAKRGKCLSGLQIQMVKRQPPRKQKSSH